MTTKYTFNFTDNTKQSFDVQAYTKNGPVSPSDSSIVPGGSSANTTLQLYGKGLKDYGAAVFQNNIYMLENFAAANPPVFSIEGQLWYKNTNTGSPVIGNQLFIRNSTGTGGNISSDWNAIILATGSSAMTGELILSGNPTSILGAAPKQYIDSHINDNTTHLSTEQKSFLDALQLTGSPILTAAEVNFLIGTQSNIQTQLNTKLAFTGGVMTLGANISFTGGEILGLPAAPTVLSAATSQQYVNDLFSTAGDGYLSSVQWLDTGTGSPTPVVSENTAQLTVTFPNASTTIFNLEGITRVGHFHTALETPIANTFDPNYGNEVQTAVEYINTEIELLKTGGVPPSATITVQRIFDLLTADLNTGTTHLTQSHFADDNRIFLSINGIKQYNNTRAEIEASYDPVVSDTSPTGLNAQLPYDFDVTVDGGLPITTTINNTGSPLTDISTFGALRTAIADELVIQLTPVSYSDFTFYTHSTGAGSSILITQPLGSPSNTYLFDAGTALTIINATFDNNQGSPIVTNTITVQNKTVADFPAGMTFTIRGSFDNNYDTYDGVYSVYITGATQSGSDVIVPIGNVDIPGSIALLYPAYDPAGSPPQTTPNPGSGSPASYGSVYLSTLGGFVGFNTPIVGIENDYKETNIAGDDLPPNGFADNVIFNYNILIGSKIESLLYV